VSRRALRVIFHGASDRGRKRPINEDAFVVAEDAGFCILCDGMGGHSSGEVASHMAVDILARLLRQPRPPATSAEDLLTLWLRSANAAIYERGSADPDAQHGRNMGTTVALLWIVDGAALVVHVGDSRVYRYREGLIEPLTRDHSITAPDVNPAARAGRKRKYVTRALGTKPDVMPEVFRTEIRLGDRFVLCSDGLTDLVRDEEIAEAVRDREGELQHVPRALINLANERGGRDNVTVVVGAVELAPVPVVERPPLADSGVFSAPPPPLEPPPPWESSDLEGLL
jgi:PPM family protein phosphatase